MNIKDFFRQGLKSSLVAMFVAWPSIGWSATVADRPLFIDAAVDHNLMFVIDDSGSMDLEVLAPAIGSAGPVFDAHIFQPLDKSGDYTVISQSPYTKGLRLNGSGGSYYPFSEQYYYLRSADYNFQYYDPSQIYTPWPTSNSDGTEEFTDQSITAAKLDPGLGKSLTVDLTSNGEFQMSSPNIPATFFVKTAAPSVDYALYSCKKNYELYYSSWYGRPMCAQGFFSVDYPKKTTGTSQCGALGSQHYDSWVVSPSEFKFKTSSGTPIPEGQVGLAPDGECLQRLELSSDVNGNNKAEVFAALSGTGSVDDFFAKQQQNFANWFSYYRRRHQAIRGAVGQAVSGLENLNVGMFWLHNRRDMSGKLYDIGTNAGKSSFLKDHYGRFGSGIWQGGRTPNRTALAHAGSEYSDSDVRGSLECRKNFTLLFTDGFANNHPSTTVAGNADSSADAPFGDATNSDTLADIAYYYYTGLRDSSNAVIPGGAMRLPAQCGTADETALMDCNVDYHMNTYTVALGMTGEKYAGISHFKVADAHKTNPDWSSLSLSGTGPEQIDDLYHAAVNGKGEYYDAQSTSQLILSLQTAMKDVQKQLGSGSNVSFNTTSLKSGGYIFSAQFTSQIWTGTLKAESIDKDGVVSGEKWDAATILDARDLQVNPRLILTNNGNGVTFDWGNLTLNQQNDLKAGGSDTLGQARLSFIKGNTVTSSEGVTFRDRASRLGAIVNSAPVYVGEPNRIWPDKTMFGATPYSAFKTSMKTRTKAVYVGANDGMLHGFDADTGEELLAYIPGFLYSTDANKGLSALTVPNLDFQSYVDLPLNTSDVYVDGAWRSIVIGGSRGATPGIFALDVTDPSNFSAANAGSTVMWEFSGNSNLGNMTEAVQIALLKWADGDYRWSAVFSNGYGAPSGKNGLFVLDIANPGNYEFIEVASGGGLSAPRLVDFMDASGDPNSDGVADRVYAGDLEGRLWAIDLSGGRSSWNVLYNGDPLFVAKDNLGNAQPITTQPDIARNTYKKDLSDPNLLVFFGTGKYLDASDIPAAGATSQTQTFYGISDRGTAVDSNGNALARDDLAQRTITGGSVTVDGEQRPVRKTDGAALDWATKFGWYVDLPSSGERLSEAPVVRGDYVVFASTIPVGGDPCGGGGSSFLTALQLDGSTDSTKSIIDVNNDGKLDGDDQGWAGVYYGDGIITGLSFIDNLLIAPDTAANKTPFLTDFGAGLSGTRRVGWHELID